jgi:C-terminal peptidase prc
MYALAAFVLIGSLTEAGRKLVASDSPFDIRQTSEGANDSDVGLLIWAMLDAIQREHVAPVERSELLKIAIRSLSQSVNQIGLEESAKELAVCRDPKEFTDLLSKHWGNIIPLKYSSTTLTDDLSSGKGSALELTMKLGSRLGNLRLIPEKEYRVNEQFSHNRYVGLGVGLGINDETLVFASIVPGGPADRAGLKSGTTVHEIDGRPTRGESVSSVVDRIRGPAGTELTLTITDPDATERRTLTLNRGVVHFDSIFGKDRKSIKTGIHHNSLSESIGWITFADITSSTPSELRAADAKARSEGIRVLILDFRSRPKADNFHHASLVADCFLDGGTIWCSAKRGQTPVPVIADRECLFRGIPLVIIVEERQTGAMLCGIAATLQDAGRAQIVGSSPDFHGDIQTTVPLKDLPFALAMNTDKLARAQNDSTWPLVPNYLASNEIRRKRPMQKQNQVKRSKKAQIQNLPQSDVMTDDVASALLLENLNLQTQVFSRSVGSRFLNDENRNVIVRRLNEQSEKTIVNTFGKVEPDAGENDEAVAIRVAKELLKGLPPKTN